MKNIVSPWIRRNDSQAVNKPHSLLHSIALVLMIVLFLDIVAGCSLGNTSRLKMRGNSMEPNIRDGQVVKAEPVQDISSLQRGDIILFEWNGDSLMKRIVALPGETIEIRQGSLMINGEAYQEPYEVITAEYNQERIRLADNEYYVLGDNRPESHDSHEIGPITGEMIKQRVLP